MPVHCNWQLPEKHQLTDAYNKRRWKRKFRSTAKGESKKARLEYGTEAVDVAPDCSSGDLSVATDDFFKKHVEVSKDQARDIDRCTTDQSTNGKTAHE